jgi:hypothetical protein
MATLLAGSTFNGVTVWGGPGNYITNTLVGDGSGNSLSGPAVDNTFFGHNAGFYAQDACGNSVMGHRNFRGAGGPQPGYMNFNVVFGYAAMLNASAVLCQNTVAGNYAAAQVGNACFNTAIGYRTMSSVNGNKNTFLGMFAGKGGFGNSDRNVGIGKYSLYCIGNATNNVAVGYKSLCNVGNGTDNIAIGSRTGGNVVNASNTIAIGYCSTTSDNNGHTAAGSGCMCCFRVGAGSWTNLSDQRDKSDIEPLDDNLGLNFIRNLRPVKFNFDFRDNYVNKCGFEYGVKDGTLKQDFESYGFIAQEIESTLTNIQAEFDALNINDDGNYRLEYENLISPIIKSLQQTIERLEFLESRV